MGVPYSSSGRFTSLKAIEVIRCAETVAFLLTGLLPAAIICLERPDEHLASFGQLVQITASRTFNRSGHPKS